MKLTPVKVRGKLRSEATARHKKLIQKRKNENAGISSASLKRRKRIPKRSLLELELPLEILERIFILSENTNFPRASPALGRILSGRQTLFATVMAAFGPSWVTDVTAQKWGEGAGSQQPVGLEAVESYVVPAPVGGNPSFQSSIIACPWATIDIILDSRQLWARMFFKQGSSVLRTKFLGNEQQLDASLMKEDEDELLAQLAEEESRQVEAKARFTEEFDEFEPAFKQPPVIWSPPKLAKYVNVHPDIRIPDALITGPWTRDMIRLLFWLRQGGARYHESQDWELKLIGLRRARQAAPLDARLFQALFFMDDFFWAPTLCEKNPRRPHLTRRPTWPFSVLVEQDAELETEIAKVRDGVTDSGDVWKHKMAWSLLDELSNCVVQAAQLENQQCARCQQLQGRQQP